MFYVLKTPECLLLIWTLLLLLYEAGRDEKRASWMGPYAMVGVLVVLISTWVFPLTDGAYWGGLYEIDGLALFFKRFFLLATFAVLWMGIPYEKQLPESRGEFFIMPLFSTIGMMLLASATDFMLIFIALELVTISFYILVAYNRKSEACLEAGVKYLIIGALSTCFLVYGIAFLFGGVGSTALSAIGPYVRTSGVTPVLLFAILLITVALGFKVAAVPFHIWVPDVYQGAPTPVTAFLAISSKAAGFVVLLKVFAVNGFGVEVPALKDHLGTLFGFLAGLTVLMGSLAAIPQRNIKRLMGYSGIGHAGFLLMGLSAVSDRGTAAVLVYLVIYAMAAVLAFFIICHISEELGGDNLHQYAGLSKRSPLLAFGLLVAMVSMAGVPPLAGFVAKFGVLGAVWESSVKSGSYLLFGIGLFGAVAGLYYYLGVVRQMYWGEAVPGAKKIEMSLAGQGLVWVLVSALIVLGLYQVPLQHLGF